MPITTGRSNGLRTHFMSGTRYPVSRGLGLVLVALAALCLAGCGGVVPSATPRSAGPLVTHSRHVGPPTTVVGGSPAQQQVLRTALGAFPDSSIESVRVGAPPD